jgi:putative hydrolase of the HAD superfamily
VTAVAGWLDAVVFDLDGTIVDTESPSFESWRRTWADHGETLLLEDWVLCVGTDWNLFDPLAELGRRVPGLDLEAVRAGKRALEATLVEGTALRDGVAAWLAEAAALDLPLAVASSSPRHWVDEHLDRLGVATSFLSVHTVTEVGVQKPDPASYLAACEALGVRPERALAVEDSVNGTAAARAAGMRVVACPNPVTVSLDLSEADIVLESLSSRTLSQVAQDLADRSVTER